MIRNRDILSSLPMLASILGDQYGIEVRIGGSEAKTDGKTIYLPSLPLDCDPDLLAMARGFLDHEAAHIRHTDFRAVKAAKMNPVTFNLFNTLEDWRIEQRLAAIFPGCRLNLHWLIRRLFLEDKAAKTQEAEVEPPAIAALKYVLLTFRAWDVPELAGRVAVKGQILDQLFPGLRGQMDAILEDVHDDCPDTKASIDYAHRLAACLQNWLPPDSDTETQSDSADKETKSSGSGTGSRQGNGRKSQRAEDEPGKCGEKQDVSPDCASEAQPVDSADDPTSSSSDQALRELSKLFSMASEQLPAGMGELVSACLEGNACEIPANGINVAQRGELQVESLSADDKLEALQATVALRTRFGSLLRTITERRCQPARKGRLNPSSLYRLSTGNPKVFQAEAHTNRDRYGSPCPLGCQRQHARRTHAARFACLLCRREGS